MRRAIVNGQIVLGQQLLSGQAIVCSDRVLRICPVEALASGEVDQVLDVHGLLICPGLIDTHIHGLAGADVMDSSMESLQQMSSELAARGVTAFLPTTMSRPLAEIKSSLDVIRQAMAGNMLPGARILGAHLEGPFLSPEYAGAQAVDQLMSPDWQLVSAYRDVIRLVTFAPELDPQGSFTAELLAMQVIPSIGHTSADYQVTAAAIARGVQHATHLFNAMPPLHHRRPGPVGAILEKRINCELIADDLHLHPSVYRLVLGSVGLERTILVSDCMRAAGMSDGMHELGGQAVQVQGGSARLPDGTLAGSVLTLNLAVQNFQAATGLAWPLAIQPASLNPAMLLGAVQTGSLVPGNYADIACFDCQMNAHLTLVRGEVVHKKA